MDICYVQNQNSHDRYHALCVMQGAKQHDRYCPLSDVRDAKQHDRYRTRTEHSSHTRCSRKHHNFTESNLHESDIVLVFCPVGDNKRLDSAWYVCTSLAGQPTSSPPHTLCICAVTLFDRSGAFPFITAVAVCQAETIVKCNPMQVTPGWGCHKIKRVRDNRVELRWEICSWSILWNNEVCHTLSL